MNTVLVQKHSVTWKVNKTNSKKKKSEIPISKYWTSVQREEKFVVFTYEDKIFPCQITIVMENGAYEKLIVKTLKA